MAVCVVVAWLVGAGQPSAPGACSALEMPENRTSILVVVRSLCREQVSDNVNFKCVIQMAMSVPTTKAGTGSSCVA